MNDTTKDSDRLLNDGQRLLADNRGGGRHRRASIGKGSADLKTQHFMRKINRITFSIGAIVIAAMAAGLIIDGIGFLGIMVTFLAVVAAVSVFAVFPRMKVPRRADLTTGDASQMVARTELWLEAQRPALPPPAVTLVDTIGVQLDALGLQLQNVDPEHPAARDIRKLVGEHLPEMVDSYRKVPPQLRGEKRAGATPDEQLAQGLGNISKEINNITRQLADGPLDDLAIKHRYLDYKYGETPGPLAGQTPDQAKD